ncbi:MAG: type VI secretion system membrane subunit TssM [Planctomycetes bacterium]|nr:type VI secretion system membrane subunit TssM [Planctomycetota bacterium]
MKLLAMLLRPPVVISGALLLLCLAIVVGGTALRDAQGWEEPSTLSLALLSLVVLLVAGFLWLLRRMQQLAKGERIQGQLERSARADVESARPDLAPDAAQLESSFRAGLQALRSTRMGKGALYALPWYVIVGPSGSGKTTMLRESGLSFLLDHDRGVRGLGGTRNCDWFFASEAILLDTAGRYSTETEDHEEWLTFLQLLRSARPEKPVNGTLLCISIRDIVEASDAGIEREAQRMRARLEELSRGLDMEFPVYLVFTKCDLIPGFVEFFGKMDRDQRRQIWGATFASDERRPADIALGDELQSMEEALAHRRIAELAIERPAARQRKVYAFPIQFRALRRRLLRFVELLVQDSPYREASALRGVFFTSGTQEGSPMDSVLAELRQTFGLPAPREDDQPSDEGRKAYFIERLFRDVVFEDRDTARISATALRRRARIRLGTIATAAGIALLMAIWSWRSDSAVRSRVTALSSAFEVARRPGPIATAEDLHQLDTLWAIARDQREALPPQLRRTGFLVASEGPLRKQAEPLFEAAVRNRLHPMLVDVVSRSLDDDYAALWRRRARWSPENPPSDADRQDFQKSLDDLRPAHDLHAFLTGRTKDLPDGGRQPLWRTIASFGGHEPAVAAPWLSATECPEGSIQDRVLTVLIQMPPDARSTSSAGVDHFGEGLREVMRETTPAGAEPPAANATIEELLASLNAPLPQPQQIEIAVTPTPGPPPPTPPPPDETPAERRARHGGTATQQLGYAQEERAKLFDGEAGAGVRILQPAVTAARRLGRADSEFSGALRRYVAFSLESRREAPREPPPEQPDDFLGAYGTLADVLAKLSDQENRGQPLEAKDLKDASAQLLDVHTKVAEQLEALAADGLTDRDLRPTRTNLSQLSDELFAAFDSRLRAAIAAQLTQRWTELRTAVARELAPRFPFADAGIDIPLAEFEAWLKVGGKFDLAFARLDELLGVDETRVRNAQQAGVRKADALSPDPAVAGLRAAVERIRTSMFDSGGKLQFRLDFRFDQIDVLLQFMPAALDLQRTTADRGWRPNDDYRLTDVRWTLQRKDDADVLESPTSRTGATRTMTWNEDVRITTLQFFTRRRQRPEIWPSWGRFVEDRAAATAATAPWCLFHFARSGSTRLPADADFSEVLVERYGRGCVMVEIDADRSTPTDVVIRWAIPGSVAGDPNARSSPPAYHRFLCALLDRGPTAVNPLAPGFFALPALPESPLR